MIDAIGDKFDEVFACDFSESQIAQVTPRPNLTAFQGAAETFVLPTSAEPAEGTFDLITVASALHWFDAGAFARRVAPLLKPGGVIAALQPYYTLDDAHQAVLDRFDKFLADEGCWSAKSQNRWDRHATQLPEMTAPDTGLALMFPADKPVSVARDFDGYPVAAILPVYRTISAVQTYLSKYPDSGNAATRSEAPEFTPGCNVLGVLERQLVAAGGTCSGKFEEPIFLLQRRQP